MKAVILVGGLGTRLRPLSINTPKSMMPVVNIPFIEYVIRRLQGIGIKEIILAISHLAEPIKKYFGDGSRFGICINYTVEETALGTAGAVKNAEQYLGYESFVILNGDIFTDLDLSTMVSMHIQRRAKITIALTPVVDPIHYGLIETDIKDRVMRFLEKPSREQITTNMINAGTYIMEPEVLNSIPKQKMFSFEREVFPPLLQKGEPIYAFPSSSYWMDIGTPQKYHQLNRDLLNGQSNQFSFNNDSHILIGKNATLHNTVEITDSAVIGNNCSIGQNVKLNGAVIIGANSIIGAGAKIEDSIIWRNTNIASEATIRHSIIANNCYIGKRSSILRTVISNNVSISAGRRLKPDSSIWPDTYLDKN
ncbi:MAG: NDP-sugar synthase [Dehalococcoidia bacterium]|nr:MAG: NDP-sugar synthase [Dehalococcoidia bacterium]